MGKQNLNNSKVSNLKQLIHGRCLGVRFLTHCTKACRWPVFAEAKTSSSGRPNLTVKRSFTARNTGSLPIFISGFFVEDSECEGYGFSVMNCRPGLTLMPNATHKVDIAFTPDFTLTRVQRNLFIRTSLSGPPLNFSMVATLPPQSLAPCWAALPRPAWEWLVGCIAIVAMVFFLVCVVFAAFFEADRILSTTFIGVTTDACRRRFHRCEASIAEEEKVVATMPLNLKEIGKEAIVTYTTNDSAGLRRRVVATMNGSGLSNGVHDVSESPV